MTGFSFPYPETGTETRPKGQGCLSCVHKNYCMALYWFKRYGEKEPDQYNGINCKSWSNNPKDIVLDVNQNDIEENQYMWEQGIGSEANRNGLTDQVGDTWRRP